MKTSKHAPKRQAPQPAALPAAPPAAAFRTPLPPDIREMRDEELSRGLELHTAFTAIARRVAFREIEMLQGFNAMGVYFRSFRLLCESTVKELSDAAKIPGETKAFKNLFCMPEKEDGCPQ